MAFAKWSVVFAAAFCLAFVIIVTFSQAPFKQPVPAMIFSYQTKPIALYWYVGGALGVGLIVGLAIALFGYINLKTALFKKNRTIRELEEKVTLLESQEKTTVAPVFPEQKLATKDQHAL